VKASAIDYLVDAGPLVAHLNESDQWHLWAEAAMHFLGDTLHTTDAALTEACYLLRHRRAVIDMLMDLIEDGTLCVHPIFPAQTTRIRELMNKYDRMDFADATLVALSEQYPRAKLITIDEKDFTIYRRRDGRPVPCIMPKPKA